MRSRSNKIRCIEFAFIACVLLTSSVWAQRSGPNKMSLDPRGSVEVGGQLRSAQGGPAARFPELRDVPKGHFINRIKAYGISPNTAPTAGPRALMPPDRAASRTSSTAVQTPTRATNTSTQLNPPPAAIVRSDSRTAPAAPAQRAGADEPALDRRGSVAAAVPLSSTPGTQKDRFQEIRDVPKGHFVNRIKAYGFTPGSAPTISTKSPGLEAREREAGKTVATTIPAPGPTGNAAPARTENISAPVNRSPSTPVRHESKTVATASVQRARADDATLQSGGFIQSGAHLRNVPVGYTARFQEIGDLPNEVNAKRMKTYGVSTVGPVGSREIETHATTPSMPNSGIRTGTAAARVNEPPPTLVRQELRAAPAVSAQRADDEMPLNPRGFVEVGAQLANVSGGHPAKFQEMREVSSGPFINRLRLQWISADSPFRVRVSGNELRDRDRSFALDVAKMGKFRAQFVWDQTPHNFGIGTSFLQQTAPGYYEVSRTLRSALQSLTLADNVRTPANGPLATLVRQELRTAPTTVSMLQRDKALLKVSYQISENGEVYAQFAWGRNRGTRPMSIGSFVRRAAPGGGLSDTGGLWEGVGQEFLEPIDHRTFDARIGAKFGGDRWQAGIEYSLSLFRNRIGDVILQNPFRVTDEQGCLPNPLNPVQPTCGASNRFKQVAWQSDLAPNNDAHTLTLWAKLDLTKRTQIRGVFSLSYWTQNDAFLPWTLNTAIKPIHWDALTTVVDPTSVHELPASSANAKTRNINQEYALVNRRETFRFLARYRSQSLDNQAPHLVFPGYAAFGDTTWRAANTDFYNLPIENLDWDFRRQNAEAGFEWKAFRNLTWKLDYMWEAWNRKFRDVNRNNEHAIRNRLDFEYDIAGSKSGVTHTVQPVRLTTLRLKLDYRYANRRSTGYNSQPLTFCENPGPGCHTPTGRSPAGSPQGAWVVDFNTQMQVGVPMEFNRLRRFDQMDRVRQDSLASVELLSGPNTSLSASYRMVQDRHDQNYYGRFANRSSYIDAQFSRIFDIGAFLYASYSREMNRFSYRDVAHLLPNPPAPPGTIIQGTLAQYPIANTWERTSRNDLDSFELGLNFVPQQGRLRDWQLDAAYAFSNFSDRITTFNPFAVRADSVLHATANPYPNISIRRQHVNLAVTRRMNERYEIGGRYWFEPYTQDDFAFNFMAPYLHGTVTSDVPKYTFQDARYGSYRASVFSVFMRYWFW